MIEQATLEEKVEELRIRVERLDNLTRALESSFATLSEQANIRHSAAQNIFINHDARLRILEGEQREAQG